MSDTELAEVTSNRRSLFARAAEIGRAAVSVVLDLAATMGRWMARAGKDLTAEADALLPVPLHWQRLWGRRFNQAAALAKVVAATRGLPLLTGALKRVRATPQQVGLSRSERAVN